MTDGRIAALDGVRGLAVAAVVLFHVDVLRGGWVGVDVFFVLSGFLITSLLLDERARTGRVGLGAFWRRRLRRLMPALLVVVAAVSMTWAVSGRSTATLRGDVLSTLGYVANWHLVLDGESYFASFEPSPLRHAWSLAIEEQFYLLWPLAILVLLRMRPSRRVAVVVVAAAASTWWMHLVSADPGALSRAYYGSDTRAATILAGCLAAFVVDATRHRAPASLRRCSNAVVVVAVALLAAVALAVPEDSPWLYRHGGFTIVAVVAAAFVVAAAHLPPGVVAGLLAGRVLVRLGLISYALYLWHWPVIVLLGQSGLGGARRITAVVVSVFLAEVTFRLVERPLRRLHRPAFAVGGGIAVVAALALAATAGPAQGSMVPAATSGTLVARMPRPAATSTTTTTTTEVTTEPTTELTTEVTARATTSTTAPPPPLELPLEVVVLGDSVAWVLTSNPAPDVPLAVRGAWHARCDILGRRVYLGERIDEEDATCPSWPEEWTGALDGPIDVVVVVLGLRQLFDLDVEGRRLAIGSPEWQVRYRAAVDTALAVLRGRTDAPVVWLDVPCYQWAAAGTAGEEHDAARRQVVNEALRAAVAADPAVTVVDYGPLVCDGSAAIPELRRDGVHPTEAAARDIWRWLGPQVIAAAERARIG